MGLRPHFYSVFWMVGQKKVDDSAIDEWSMKFLFSAWGEGAPRSEKESWCHMDVSENSGFSPQIIHFKRVFHCKPSILGCFPIFGNTHMYPIGSYDCGTGNFLPTWMAEMYCSERFQSHGAYGYLMYTWNLWMTSILGSLNPPKEGAQPPFKTRVIKGFQLYDPFIFVNARLEKKKKKCNKSSFKYIYDIFVCEIAKNISSRRRSEHET